MHCEIHIEFGVQNFFVKGLVVDNGCMMDVEDFVEGFFVQVIVVWPTIFIECVVFELEIVVAQVFIVVLEGFVGTRHFTDVVGMEFVVVVRQCIDDVEDVVKCIDVEVIVEFDIEMFIEKVFEGVVDEHICFVRAML